MSEEYFDLTPFVNAFHLETKTTIPTVEDGVFTYEWKSLITTDINFTISGEFMESELFQKPFEHKSVMKMVHSGKFWFDRKFRADVIMKSFDLDDKTGEMTAVYDGMNIVDLSNNGYLARFLRWVLRR